MWFKRPEFFFHLKNGHKYNSISKAVQKEKERTNEADEIKQTNIEKQTGNGIDCRGM